ncbi:A/G-specific adenine glycosylase [Moheibacter sediminis]|uniref:Adenine DNA glycosylase n=1 Tax=Moheibacter sediminis TaxID=1434700 RepID=A0A1W1YBJ0_9FLAO|nr:A/G-specific adenine glycosylase [Moheibacter sediminis]SMC33525.1 A/G-specific DNA-adenine glycosylase [Moheibacter sediminis]
MTFNSLILIWFDKNKRNLPWRQHKDPYKIWLSEIILQQTRVAQGTAYYLRFADTFPTVRDLAKADETEVLKLWQGLGYYSRARNLHFTAKHIVNELNGIFPENFKDLMKLKGVGEYTAAAIASIAFDEALPAIDGNAFRLYARYFNIHVDISSPQAKKYFFELGKQVIDPNRPGDFNQAVMEMGATICVPVNPKCGICPVNNSCEAIAQKTVELLPIKSKKVKVKQRNFHFLDITAGEKFLIKKRIENDVWKNLYNFPLFETDSIDQQLEELNLNLSLIKEHEEKHILTHQRLQIVFWKANVDEAELKNLAEKLDSEIISQKELEKYPLPRPMEKYFSKKYKV